MPSLVVLTIMLMSGEDEALSMFSRSWIEWLRGRRGTRGSLGAAIFAVSLTLFMSVGIAGSQACSRISDLGATVGVMQMNADHSAPGAEMISLTVAAPLMENGTTPCCGGAFHSGGANCSAGTCSSCPATLAVAITGLTPDDASCAHRLPQAERLIPSTADPDLRPPRIIA